MKHLWIIVASTVLVSVAAAIYTAFFVTPVYTATTTSLVMVDDLNSTKGGNINTTISLMSTYAKLVKSDKTMQAASDLIVDENYTPEVISGMVSVSYEADGLILYITARSTSPENAAILANKVSEAAAYTIDIATLDVYNKAVAPSSPSSPSMVKNVFIGFVLAFVASYGICLAIDLSNTRIVTEQQLADVVGAPVIGVIPYVEYSNATTKENNAGGSKI